MTIGYVYCTSRPNLKVSLHQEQPSPKRLVLLSICVYIMFNGSIYLKSVVDVLLNKPLFRRKFSVTINL